MSDDSDDDETWRKRQQRALTDSERQAFAAQWSSGVPAVGDSDRDDTSPIDLFERAPRGAATDLVAKLRRNPEKLIPFLGEFAEWVVRRMREQSSSEQSAVAELRELLNRPPNGAMKRIEEQVRGLMTAVTELAERMDEVEKIDDRVRPVEETIKSVKGFSKWAMGGLITTVLGSAVGIIATLQAKAERQGAADERAASQSRRLERLERLSDERSRGRHDYDYDIAPRPGPLKKDP